MMYDNDSLINQKYLSILLLLFYAYAGETKVRITINVRKLITY